MEILSFTEARARRAPLTSVSVTVRLLPGKPQTAVRTFPLALVDVRPDGVLTVDWIDPPDDRLPYAATLPREVWVDATVCGPHGDVLAHFENEAAQQPMHAYVPRSRT